MEFHRPIIVSDKEWEELARVPAVREVFALETGEAGKELAFRCYGVRFDFVDTQGAYIGELFVLHPDYFRRPEVLVRDRKKIWHVQYSESNSN